MKALDVGIVEDEMIIAEDMKDILVKMGYEVPFVAVTAEEAREGLKKNNVDILLIDIRIRGNESGIDLARFVQAEYDIPFIYVTSNADKATIEEAKQTHPYGYILKPFDERDLYASIEIALTNFRQRKGATAIGDEAGDFIIKDSLFVRDKNFMRKVKFAEISYLEADGNYTQLVTEKQKFTLRNTLKEFEPKLPPEQFARIHKSYIVRLEAITGLNAQHVLIGSQEIPIGRSYHDWLLGKINRLSG